jgi:box C/D snoRNA protein 1
MNRYTHGTMMDDYVFLEDMNRRVSDCGNDIVRSGYGTLRGRRGKGEMGTRLGKTRNGISRTKRDVLKSQLELRDIEMDLLPSGMERRMLNQSTWDLKYVDYQLSRIYKIGSHK